MAFLSAGQRHLRDPTGGSNAARKMALGEHLVPGGLPWWLVPKMICLESLYCCSDSMKFCFPNNI